MIKYYCDRCGSEVKEMDYLTGTRIFLCLDCEGAFHKFMGGLNNDGDDGFAV